MVEIVVVDLDFLKDQTSRRIRRLSYCVHPSGRTR
jgi:hypothetical protein